MHILKKILSFILIFSLSSLLSCREEEDRYTIPYVYVDVRLNLNNYEYQDLKHNGGYVYIKKEGVKGIIIYRESQNSYYAFERNCPYRSGDSCAVVEVDPSSFFMIDKCCNSTFDMTGFPSGGPARLSLKRYNLNLENNYLYIKSDF